MPFLSFFKSEGLWGGEGEFDWNVSSPLTSEPNLAELLVRTSFTIILLLPRGVTRACEVPLLLTLRLLFLPVTSYLSLEVKLRQPAENVFLLAFFCNFFY